LHEPGEAGPADAGAEEPAAIAGADRAEELAEPVDATGPRDAGDRTADTDLAEPASSHAVADTGQDAEKAQSADVRDLLHSTDAVGPGQEAEDAQPISTAMHVSEAGEGEPVDAEPPEVDGLPEVSPSVPGTRSGDAANIETDATDRAGVRPDVAAEHPDLYNRPDSPPPDVEGPHESPERWSADINPSNGKDNCGDCARAVQETWEGNPQVAAAGGPEDNSLMTDWAGASPEPTSIESINDKLTEQGSGSSAIVGFDWEDGGGHWFNAVNENGSIKAVDGQSGQVEAWPPSDLGLGFSAVDMRNTEAIFFDADGRIVR